MRAAWLAVSGVLALTPPAWGQEPPVSVTAGNGMLRWSLATTDACLTLWAGDSAAARRRLCLAGQSVQMQALARDGSVTATRALAGDVRSVGDGARASVPIRALGLNEPVLYWQLGSPGASPLPAVGKGTLDLRAPPRTLPALLAPPSHPDSLDAGASPLDVREVTFGQQGTLLVLRLHLQRLWRADSLSGGSACLLIGRTSALAHPARLCLERRSGVVRLRHVGASVDGRTLRASVLPSALGLGLGPFWWVLETRWTDAATCPAGCADRVPDSGAFPSTITALATPPCFGAAARPSCRNPALRAAVYPRPDSAVVWPNSVCRPLRPFGAVFDPCAFGFTGAHSRGTVALVGDSHAEHWRAALEVVAQARRWRGISITRPGCPFSVQIPLSPSLGPGACAGQHAATITWLRAHPEVRTLFVSDWAEPPGGPQGGIGGYGGGAAAYGAMLDRLPASVRHVYVLRDIPATTFASTACVKRRLRRHQPIGRACASPRAAVLIIDPGAAAAAGRRARVIDLTRRFCEASRCYPVIGGVYVHKDDNHMNAVFAATLGPFILRAVAPDRVSPRTRG